MVVLRGILPADKFNHFLVFHSAMYILACDSSDGKWVSFARNLLKQFVSTEEQNYGIEFLSYNAHSILHLADDVDFFGPLDSMSCFPFENFMTNIKKLLRHHHKELEQVAKRLHEMSEVDCMPCTSLISSSTLKPMQLHKGGPLVLQVENKRLSQYKVLQTSSFTIKATSPDNCFLTSDETIVIVRNILKIRKEFFVVCSEFSTKRSLYTYPFDSRKLSVVTASNLKNESFLLPLSSLYKKCVLIPSSDGNSFSVFPFVNRQCHFKNA